MKLTSKPAPPQPLTPRERHPHAAALVDRAMELVEAAKARGDTDIRLEVTQAEFDLIKAYSRDAWAEAGRPFNEDLPLVCKEVPFVVSENAAITLEAVNELRERTDMPRMECKRALEDAGGNVTLAEELLRMKAWGGGR